MNDEMDEIWELYADDGAQALDAMEEALEALQNGEGDQKDHIGALFRAVHTFKGNSRVLGLATVESRAHVSEDLIGLVRDSGVALNSEILDILMLTGDTLRGMLDHTASDRSDVDPGPSQKLYEDLKKMVAKYSGEGGDEPEAAAPAEPEAPAEEAAPEAPAAASAAPAAPAAADPMASMFAALDDLGDSDTNYGDDDDLFGEMDDNADVAPEPEPEPEPVAAAPAPEPEPAPAPAPEPEPAPAPAAAEPAPAPEAAAEAPADAAPSEAAKRLLEDVVYHKIYSDMVAETLGYLEEAIGKAPAEMPADTLKKGKGLSYAAKQLGLDDWVTELDRLNAADGNATDVLKHVVKKVKQLRKRDLGIGGDDVEDDAPEAAPAPAAEAAPAPAPAAAPAPAPAAAAPAAAPAAAAAPAPAAAAPEAPAAPAAPAEDPTTKVLRGLADLFTRVSETGLRFATDDKPTPKELDALSQTIIGLVKDQGYVRVTRAAELLAMATTANSFRTAELQFYEELAAVEAVLPRGAVPVDLLTPTKLLRIWGADNIFDTLQKLRNGLEENNGQGETWFVGFEGLMRRAFHACNYFNMETAAQLTMALIDLFARVRVGGTKPDVILIQIARGFVDTMELVFDALDQGDNPDTSKIEKLFEEASTVCFLASGMVTAKSIEQRLGLPKEFHRVLSPESVKKAQSAIENGLNFWVIRADLNDDEDIAQAFLDWVSSKQARMITNVTVFQDDITLFDFLVATSLPDDHLQETLIQIDPSAKKLFSTMRLEVKEEENAGAHKHSDDPIDFNVVMGSGGDGLRLLETIGEISSGQAMVQELVRQMAMRDLMQEIEMSIQHSDAPPLNPRHRTILREIMDNHMGRLQQLSEAETQLASQLGQLQEESVAMRSRPANVLLKPLASFVETLARKHGGSARLSAVGGEITLDQTMITDLRHFLKALVTIRLQDEGRPGKFHISLSNEDDRVVVELTDDGKSVEKSKEFGNLVEDVKRKGGSLKSANVPNGGQRFQLSLPLHMIVLDGMVVRVGDVRYVLPIESIQRIHQGKDVVPVVAARHMAMLRLDDGDLVKIQPLSNGKTKIGDSPDGLYVIVRYGEIRRAIPVDELLGQQLVLLRPLRGVLSSMRDLSGIAILTGGDVGMVLSVSSFASA
ncbi:chemotaxis protein CheA [Donghicola sp. C2-DW-16]|uniref:histidine kinase n=1 Tax=Donghicola mangrovi TaxID=2729614 RepID=A0ABX2PA47_9RHOB|nr:Hpt domain-containing protein [Donghicola mangrovi]NVO26349.1 chemotaxis protein CheA [Donghicola mangrovi]